MLPKVLRNLMDTSAVIATCHTNTNTHTHTNTHTTTHTTMLWQ